MTTRLMELEILTQGLARALTEAAARLHAIEALIKDISNDEHVANMRAGSPLSVSDELAERYESGDM